MFKNYNFSRKTVYVFLLQEKYELTEPNTRQRQYLSHYLSDEGLEGTIVHRALSTLHTGSLEVIRLQSLKGQGFV